MNGEIDLNFGMNYKRNTDKPVVEYGEPPFQQKATIGLVATPSAPEV